MGWRAWLGALALTATMVAGSSCAPPYPACRHDKHCKIQQGERCVSDVCQECKADADCTDPERPICTDLRCVAEYAPPPPGVKEPAAATSLASQPCTASADCPNDQACVEGQCSPCTEDAQCSSGECDAQTGRCGTIDPAALATELGADLTDAYRSWLLGRWEIALQGNQQPDTYPPCRRGRHCRLRWDVDWQLFDSGSTEVHADPALALMLADGL
ncbi:MAG: hypothetical protein KDK70_38015, partial [Myxococcales bacterium]|nr:hypothetical protein [Myxococcales bacterium]